MTNLFKTTKIFGLAVLVSTMVGCYENMDHEDEASEETGKPTNPLPPGPPGENYVYTSSATRNLNIVYFMPTDVVNLTDSHRRLSEILLQGREFYRQGMIENGFGDKTFNLLVDDAAARVKITYVQGNSKTNKYPYGTGHTKIQTEIANYFAANPDDKTSDHTLVIIPVNDITSPTVPFYGVGRWCYVLDYVDMDVQYLGENSTNGNRATQWIGGLMHELGHGLNLPHNKETVSASIDPLRGTALMGSGNSTYGKTPTYLTKASCSILNNNQIFTSSSDAFYTGANTQITGLQASYSNGNININGTFQSDETVNYVSYYNNLDAGAEYDAVTFASSIAPGSNSFNISMPINELHVKGNSLYELNLRFAHDNGEIVKYSFEYNFVNDVPVLEFGSKIYLDKANWNIIQFSSEETSNGAAANVIDGNVSTWWHSRWSTSPASFPHHVVVDASTSITASGVSILQRDGSRKVKDVEILVSNDNVNWISKGDFILADINTVQDIDLPSTSTFRYLKIIAKSAHDGLQFAAIAELYCY